jgi:hypothetical protein
MHLSYIYVVDLLRSLNLFFSECIKIYDNFLRYFINPKYKSSSIVRVRDTIALPDVGLCSFYGATSRNMLRLLKKGKG